VAYGLLHRVEESSAIDGQVLELDLKPGGN
jgi:hypothetical protein